MFCSWLVLLGGGAWQGRCRRRQAGGKARVRRYVLGLAAMQGRRCAGRRIESRGSGSRGGGARGGDARAQETQG
jgi:hypothetical protein